MSGVGTFSGTSYQAKLIALVGAHVVAEKRLRWIETLNDVPVAVSAETGGVGDDIRLEFASSNTLVEVQAKHGLRSGSFGDAVRQIDSRFRPGTSTLVVIATNRASTEALYTDVPVDLARIRDGRNDEPPCDVLKSLQDSGIRPEVLRALYVLAIDVDEDHHPEAKHAIFILESVLTDPRQADQAWAILVADAGGMCAGRRRRTRGAIVELLEAKGIKIKPSPPHQSLMQKIEFAADLTKNGQPELALSVLERLDRESPISTLPPGLQFSYAMERASALNNLQRFGDALVFANQAVLLRPRDGSALGRAASSALLAGDSAGAEALSSRAVECDVDSVAAWRSRALVASKCGLDPVSPPPSVSANATFQFTLAQLAFDAGDWPEALRLIGLLRSRGDSSPNLLLLQCYALLGVARQQEKDELAKTWTLIRDIATVAARDAEVTAHGVLGSLYVVRGVANRSLGNIEAADADTQRALAIDPDDIEARRHAALNRVQSGEPQAALDLLQHPDVSQSILALAMRASLRALLGDVPGGQVDLAVAFALAGIQPHSDDEYIAMCRSALDVDRIDDATQAATKISADAKERPPVKALLGTIAIRQGHWETGIALFIDVITADTRNATIWTMELAQCLARVGRLEECLVWFEQVPLPEFSSSALHNFAVALFQLEQYEQLFTLLNSVFTDITRPEWAVDLDVRIALKRDDAPTAEAALAELMRQGNSTTAVRFELAKLMLDDDRMEMARPVIEELAQRADLTPEDMAWTAQFLMKVGEGERAVDLAFLAFRRAPSSAAVARAFILIVLGRKEKENDSPSTIASNTYARLTLDDGTERHLVILDGDPIDPNRNEVLASSNSVALFLGRGMGDTVVENKGNWRERVWHVAEVKPAFVLAFRDLMQHYEERFPEEPFLFRFRFDANDEPKSFQPMLLASSEARERTEHLLAMYNENIFPIGLFATLDEVPIPKFMAAIVGGYGIAGPLFVEWGDYRRNEARCILDEAATVVVTRSALWTLECIDAIFLLDSFVIHAPRSLVREVQQEIKKLEETFAQGNLSIHSGPRGIQATNVAPGDEATLARLNRLRDVVARLKPGQVHARPLSLVGTASGDMEIVRDQVGASSFDSLALSLHLGLPLYCDDLGLRRLPIHGQLANAFSTIVLLERLFDTNSEMQESVLEWISVLSQAHFATIVPSTRMLEAASRCVGREGRQIRGAIFSLVGNLSFQEALAAAGQVIGIRAHDRIRVIEIEELTQCLLTALTRKWSTVECCRLLPLVVDRVIPLLPSDCVATRSACEQFFRDSIKRL
jgi:tetratricopeptide (TPR) repeat protein